MVEWEGGDSNGPETREAFDNRFLKDAQWEEQRNYTFRTCMETGAIIWPFQNAFKGTARFWGPGMPVEESKWMNGPTFTYLMLTGKIDAN